MTVTEQLAAAKTNTEAFGIVIVHAIKTALAPRDAKIAALEQRIAALEHKSAADDARIAALEARPSVQDKGTWKDGVVYDKGDIVTHGGSGWICSETHLATGTDLNHDCFRLFVKRGRDAR